MRVAIYWTLIKGSAYKRVKREGWLWSGLRPDDNIFFSEGNINEPLQVRSTAQPIFNFAVLGEEDLHNTRVAPRLEDWVHAGSVDCS